ASAPVTKTNSRVTMANAAVALAVYGSACCPGIHCGAVFMNQRIPSENTTRVKSESAIRHRCLGLRFFIFTPSHLISMWPNARHEPLPEAEAQRRLQAVGSMPLFGEALRMAMAALLSSSTLPSVQSCLCHCV